MDSTSPTLLLSPSKDNGENTVNLFDTPLLQKKPTNLPSQFIWPSGDLVSPQQDLLNEPLIDLAGLLNGDEAATTTAADLARAACLNHGFFQVVNHGVDSGLIQAAHEHMDAFSKLPMSKKICARRKPGSIWGYSGAHADRYSSKLPWKETFSFGFNHRSGDDDDQLLVVDYFTSVLGEEFEEAGFVYQRYCEAMKELSLSIMEILAISLGVERKHYRKFFEDGSSIMRCNYYPPCKEAGLTLGTGPHCDPTSLTILHQDQVGGLQVFVDGKWQVVQPHPDALVINIGDTFMFQQKGQMRGQLVRNDMN
ncbi:hypothetical protein LguiA_003435 [Lonicera macranthoides]